MGLPRDNYLCDYKIKLKENPTEAEKRLWFGFLRDYPVPFVSQKIIGRYIVDFFCNTVRISIELDGSQHYEKVEQNRDIIRTGYLEMLEVKELRFPNSDIWNDFDGVCELIHNEVQARRNDLICLPLSNLTSKR